MSDLVTNETSLRLEAAGFPRPEIQFGQVWYTQAGTPLLVHGGRIGGNSSLAGADGHVFAPTATDILKELSIVAFSHWFEFIEGTFQIRIFFQGGGERQYFHSNPAEACAAAWLEINEKK